MGGCLFGMVIQADFLLLEREFLVAEVVAVEAVDVVRTGFFCLFQAWLFGRYDGCESGDTDRGCGWCASVGVVGVVCGVRMGVVVGCVGTRGESVVSSGGSASVTDVEGTGWKDCCRLLNGISGELWVDLPYVSHSRSISAMPFCRLAWKDEVVKVIEALIDQCVGRSVGGSKGLNGL